jgi:hypothetical protein
VATTANRVRGERLVREFDAGTPRSALTGGNRGEWSLRTATGIDTRFAIMISRSSSASVSRTSLSELIAAPTIDDQVHEAQPKVHNRERFSRRAGPS